MVGNVVFTILMTSFAVWLFVGARNAVQRRELLNQALAILSRMKDSQNYGPQDREELRRVTSKLSDQDAEVVKTLEENLASRARKLADYSKALEAFKNAGGVEPSTLNSNGAISDRLALVQALTRANDALLQDTRTRTSEIQARLGSFRGNKIADRLLSEFPKNDRTALAIKSHETKIQICEAYKTCLTLLQRTWRRWSWNQNEGKIVFRDSTVMRDYNQNLANLQKLAHEEEELQKKMLGLMKK